MSFREKSAWITLITLFVLTILFFLHFPQPWQVSRPDQFMFHVTLLMIATFIGVEIIAHIIIAIRSPRDARTPKDERERLIELKSVAVAFYVYVIASLGSVFVTLHLGANQFSIGYLLLLSFVLAEIVNYALRVIHYQRGR